MNKYFINVHYDAVVEVEVIAETREEALDKAPYAAEHISLEDAEIVDIKCFVVHKENYNENEEI